ncbi:L,D-transpeptidase family protein [Brevibacillus fulvus]|uniref:L,D-TPase catalytic domain-containing protein n=1 Tax=Brevibacillus fulvus TaxID=1125967 RepID=A0A938Y1P2_9BACL|nr:L,D-transpeptidase family protein [Brevibacillus fulvus]MBM7591701.1 hypothetical protein [Brevibacillus fulvus]
MHRKIVAVSLCLLLLSLIAHPCLVSAKQNDLYIYINLWHNRLELKTSSGTVVKSFRVAPGAKETPSPIGKFRIIQKSRDWGGGFGTRWLGLNVSWGIYGIHGTNRPEAIGRYVSHGCIRMKNRDVEQLFPYVSVGTPVIIDGPIMGHESLTYRDLVPGSRGALVQLVQNRLKAAGYYWGSANGIYDRGTELAVIRFQKKEKLKVTGQIHLADLQYLGIVE